ncbi:GIN domain-containing protein [Brevundimonas sp. TWP2-3-2]|uniref:GIN domain-containing protein n=1 Tax=unclassified Brevundimonas TaxID=2622653 RepID=UPI003CE7DA09
MIRTLLIIAAAGLVLATASIAGAFALGGRDMARHGWEWTFNDRDGDTVSFRREDGTRDLDTTRTLEWTGGQTLTVDLSADVEYVQGDTPGVTVTGPAQLVEKVRLVDGRLTWADTDGPNHETVVFGRNEHGRGIWVHSEEVKIVVTAPAINTFNVEGSASVLLRDYDQDTLSVDISGSGEVSATGRTRALEVDISGSGDADLGSLVTTDANVAIAGSGDAVVAPTGKADISISGSGDTVLTTRPATVNQQVSGSGEVDFATVSTTITTSREIGRAEGVSVSTSREVPAP